MSPRIRLAEIRESPLECRWDHRETGDLRPERLGYLEVVDVDHMTPQLSNSH